MGSVPENAIFGQKMIVKSGLEKFILKSLHVGRWLFLLLNLRFLDTDSILRVKMMYESVK